MRPPSNFDVAPGVFGSRSVMVNYYFVVSSATPTSWVLVDAGLRGSGLRLLREATRRFGANNPPRAIILTHGHFDHIGALPWLLQHWTAPVYAHEAELPFLDERHRYPPPDPSVGGGLMALSSPLYPRRPAKLPVPVLPLPANGVVPELPEWRWIATPGHSPGHVSLWRAADAVLISGDALVSTRQESASAVWAQRVEVRPPPAYFTPDWRGAYESLLRLRALSPATLASGHGQPLTGSEWLRDFDRLLAEFPERGLPRHGRYVPQHWPRPAIA